MMDGIRDILFYLAGVQAPSGATVSGLETHTPWLRLAFWLGLVVAGLGLARWAYHRETIRPGRRLERLLIGLRTLAVAALGWLIFTPVNCSARLQGEKPNPVAAVLDQSRSMGLTDNRPDDASKDRLKGLGEIESPASRLEVGRGLLQAGGGDLATKLSARGPLKFFSAGDSLRALEYTPAQGVPGPWAEWQATGNRTALGEAVIELCNQQPPPGAIILFTDGRQNAGPDLAAACKLAAAAGIPVHLVGLGAPEPPAILLRDLEAPEVLQVGEKAVARARVRAVGLDPADASARIEVTAEINGVEVARELLPNGNGNEQTAALGFVVPKAASGSGLGKVVVRARLAGATRPPAPGMLERATRLTDKPARILLVDGVPRWDFRFLLMQLVREGPAGLASPAPGTNPAVVQPGGMGVAVAPYFVLLTGDKNLVTQEPFLPTLPPRDELMRFDAIWLGDIDPKRLGPDGAETIRRFVEEGGGLILQAGPSFQPGTWAGTPLAELLPVEPDAARPANPSQSPFRPRLTADGLASDALRLADTPEASRILLEELPGLQWNAPVKRLKPGARMLLSHPTQRCANGPEPILATQSYGRGRVAWLGTDETWRWRQNTGETHFARFWTQWLVWAAASRSDPLRRVRLSVDRRETEVGQTGELRARILDANMAPDSRSRLPAELIEMPRPGEASGVAPGREVELRAIAGQPGEFALAVVHDKPGHYRLRVPGDDGPGVEWTVLPAADPEGPGGLAEGLLTEAARQAGTRLWIENEALGLADQINPGKRAWESTADLPRMHPAWFAVLALALGLEWALRRGNQMS